MTHPLLAPLGLLVAMVVVLEAGIGEVGFGTEGRPFLLAAACGTFLAGASVFLLWRRAPDWVPPVTLTVLGVSVVAMHLLDPTGPVIGLMLLAAFAPLQQHRTIATSITLGATLAFNAIQILLAQKSVVLTIATDTAVLFFYLFGTLLRQEHQQRERGNRLLAELEASRESERAAVAEAARARMARELHDVLAHTLSGLTIQLQAAHLLAQDGARHDDLREVIDRSYQLSRSGVAEARRAVGALRGETLPGVGSLPDLVTEHRLASGSEARMTTSGTPVPMSSEESLTLYRTAQEALTNARKHAPGAAVEVRLEWSEKAVTLIVDNDRADITPSSEAGANASTGGGYGLTGMAERAQLVGGALSAGPTDWGFRVTLALPIGGEEDDRLDHR